MTLNLTGDLVSGLLSRRTSASLKSELQKLTAEAASGRVTDLTRATNGDLAPAASIRRSLALIGAYEASVAKANLKLSGQDLALLAIDEQLTDLGSTALAAANSGDIALDAVVSSASEAFSSAISALTTQLAGGFLFSGAGSENAPLASPNDILIELETLTAGALTANDFYQRIDAWFNQPGGFEVSGYLGGAANSTGVKISSSESLQLSLTADAPEIRGILKDLAVFALVADGKFLGSLDERAQLIGQASSSVIMGKDDLVDLRAEIGEKLERLSVSEVQNTAEKYSLNKAYNDITSIDLFETATRLEDVQLQLESLYIITARTSRLNLTEFLR